MFYLVSSADSSNMYSVMDTSDNVVEKVSESELIRVIDELKIPIIGVSCESGRIVTKVPCEPEICEIKHKIWKDYIVVCYSVRYGHGYRVFMATYNYKKNKYTGRLGYDNIEYYPGFNIYTSSEDATECEISFTYYDKHYYREDKGEEFEATIKLSVSGEKLKVNKTGFLPAEY